MLKKQKKIRKKIIQKAFEYLKDKTTEEHILLYEQAGKIKIVNITEDDNEYSVGYSTPTILSHKQELQSQPVYSAHNHPSNDYRPSMSDFAAGKELKSVLRLNGILLLEEFIVTPSFISSFPIPNDITLPFYVEPLQSIVLDDEQTTKQRERIIPLHTVSDLSTSDILRKYLHEGYEVILTKENVHLSISFTFEDILEITNHFQEVVIFGFPSFSTKRNWERILDINNVFGAIEIYCLNKEKELVPLKKELFF